MPNNNPTGKNQYSGKSRSGGPRQAGGDHPAPARDMSGSHFREPGRGHDRSGDQRGGSPAGRRDTH